LFLEARTGAAPEAALHLNPEVRLLGDNARLFALRSPMLKPPRPGGKMTA